MVEHLEAVNNPEKPEDGSRQIPFSREMYIEQSDFMENPPSKFFRLKVGGEVRLRYAYIIRCEEVIKDASGKIIQLNCTYDAATKSGEAASSRKVKGTIHWVSLSRPRPFPVRLYDRLFKNENPEDVPAGQTFLDNMNPDSLTTIEAKVEPAVGQLQPDRGYSSSGTAISALTRRTRALEHRSSIASSP